MSFVDGSSLRADAARNRERIVAAARELFAAEGLEVSMRQIARRAGVGEPTLRRRFPTREGLIAEAFEDKIALYADLAEQALQDDDARRALEGFIRQIAEMQLSDRGFTDVLTLTFPESMRAEGQRRRAYAAVVELVARARTQGVLREDFSPEDVVLVLMAHAGVVAAGGSIAPALSARLLGYLFDSFFTGPTGPLPPAPSMKDTYRALLRLHDEHAPAGPGA